MAVAGADAARIGRAGWAVVVIGDGDSVSVRFEPDLEEVAVEVELLAVDIPIGLPDDPVPVNEAGRRLADVEARQMVGKRWNTVFWTPPLKALQCESYAEARRLFPGLSAQAYHLRTRIFEVRALAERHPNNVIEYHPELNFRALHGEPLAHRKKCWNGAALRRKILSESGIELPDALEGPPGELAIDDVLDAAVGALTARAVLGGRGVAYGATALRGLQQRGLIWAPERPRPPVS